LRSSQKFGKGKWDQVKRKQPFSAQAGGRKDWSAHQDTGSPEKNDRQQRRVEVFDSSLRGDLERAIARTDFQIALARSIVWWGLVPAWVATALWLAVFYRLLAMPAWTYVFIGATVLGSFVVVVSGKQQSITNRFQPRQRELESLRAKLADPQR
jgi:hypothetical protein